MTKFGKRIIGSSVTRSFFNDPNPDPNPNPNPNPNPEPAKFTQDQVNALLAKEKGEWQRRQKDTLTQLEALQQNQKLTAEEKAALQTQIDQITSSTQTKEEQYKAQLEKWEKKHKDDTTALKSEGENWKIRFESAEKNRDLTDAAVEFKAFNPAQIKAILMPNTVIEEALDDKGQPTGKLVTMVNFDATNKEGQPVKLKLTPKDAVKAMTEQPEVYGNLFKNDSNSGVGGSNVGGKIGTFDIDTMSPQEYAKKRDQIVAQAKRL